MGARIESKFEKKFIDRLRLLPNSWWPPKPDVTTIRGNPDRVGCVNGLLVAIEFKKSYAAYVRGSTSSNLQEYTLREIRNAGGYGVFCFPENAEEVYEEVRGIAVGKC